MTANRSPRRHGNPDAHLLVGSAALGSHARLRSAPGRPARPSRTPCVSYRVTLADGDGGSPLSIFAASLWSFAVPALIKPFCS